MTKGHIPTVRAARISICIAPFLLFPSFTAAAPLEPVPSPAVHPNPLERPLVINIQQATLRDTIAFLESTARVRFDPLWISDAHADGLDPDALITLRHDRLPLRSIIERILAQTPAGEPTWQIADDGAIQIGPRSRLNNHRRLIVYNVADLLIRIPNYPDAATIDLQAALQSTPGGSILRETQERPPNEPSPDPMLELTNLITATIEPDQWDINGGQGATLRTFHNQLIINAPGYIHRQLNPRVPRRSAAGPT